MSSRKNREKSFKGDNKGSSNKTINTSVNKSGDGSSYSTNSTKKKREK